MGKLLQKLVHGIAPSWLTKVKSSTDSSPKKLLPSIKAGSSSTSSNKSPSSSTQPPPAATVVVPALAVEKSTSQDESITTVSQSWPSTQRKESEAANCDRNPQAAAHPSENVKEYKQHSFQNMLLQEDISSQSQNDHSHPNITVELHDAQLVEEKHKEHQHMQDDTHHHSQSIEELKHKKLQHVQDDIHNSPDGSQISQWDSAGYHESAYHELLGVKRKSRSLQSDDGEEDEEELELGGDGAGGGDIKRWVWKRRKGEKGLMSCELPESICSIVGNGRAVVKQSMEPHLALWESMVEMIVGNGLWELGNLEFLLYCYLSLNEPHLHPIIQSSFLQVLKDLERIS